MVRERKGRTVAHQTNKKHTVAGSVTVWAHQTAPRPFRKMVKHTGGFVQETHLNIYIQEQAFAALEEVLMAFKVTNVINGDTFEVFPPWRWEGQSGIRVRVAGIVVLFEGEVGYEKAKAKLKSAVEGREVELRNEKEVDYDKLVCDVYVDGENVADYLPH